MTATFEDSKTPNPNSTLEKLSEMDTYGVEGNKLSRNLVVFSAQTTFGKNF